MIYWSSSFNIVILFVFCYIFFFFFFFFNDPPTTEIYTLPTRRSSDLVLSGRAGNVARRAGLHRSRGNHQRDRKSTRLNSSHSQISYAVFCLKKKKINTKILQKLKPQKHSIPHTEPPNSHLTINKKKST